MVRGRGAGVWCFDSGPLSYDGTFDMGTETEELKAMLTGTPKKKKRRSSQDLLSTGSKVLNLACSGKAKGGFYKGMYVFLVGDSSSGKTFLSLTCLAEAAINPEFDDYRFILDEPEGGAQMDITKFFGPKVKQRLERRSSASIEDFYYSTDDDIQDGRPFIKILDSMDSLSSDDEESKFQEQKTAARKGKTAAGSFGDGKAKKNSQNIRRLLRFLRRTGSILIIISQTRDNLGFGFEKKTRSGGRALRFYADLEIWSSIGGKITKDVLGTKRKLGINCKIDIKKNRLTGDEASVMVPIYKSIGMDDLGGCVDYLVTEGRFKKVQGGISAPDFEFKGTKEKLIRLIENDEREQELFLLVSEVWNEIQEKCTVTRKSKYHDE